MNMEIKEALHQLIINTLNRIQFKDDYLRYWAVNWKENVDLTGIVLTLVQAEQQKIREQKKLKEAAKIEVDKCVEGEKLNYYYQIESVAHAIRGYFKIWTQDSDESPESDFKCIETILSNLARVF